MSNFKTILDYYQIIWNQDNLFNLYSLFHDQIFLVFEALDDQSKNFLKEGNRKVFNVYLKWADSVKRLETEVVDFSVHQESDNVYLVNYEINQYQEISKDTWGWFNFHVRERLHFEDFLLRKIGMTRISKKLSTGKPTVFN